MGRFSAAAVLAALPAVFALPTATNGTGVTCPTTATFTPVTASSFFASINPGWNLGNTLDAVPNEGSWNNPPVVAATFDDVKAAGYRGVRLPVTWAYHFNGSSPDWTVDPVFLQRVSDVIDIAISKGFYTIVNVHHDSWTWADLTNSATNVTMVEEKLYRLWYQIGTKLACKSQYLAFEPINEIPGNTAEHGAIVNKLNDLFLQAINDAGGFNPQRVVTLVGAGEDSLKTIQWFQRPDTKYKNPWGIQYHYYSPYDFIFSAWGKTTWGSDADKASLDADLAAVRGNFSDVPLIIGEWAASPVATETAARWRYFDFFVRTAAKYNTSTILWDNGADFLNRATHQWRDQVAQDIYVNAYKGAINSLPDSTTDGSVLSQQSSAYIYIKRNSTITDVALPFKLSGNTLKKNISVAATKKALSSGTDYSVSGETITVKAAFLAKQVTATTPLGSVANLTLSFNRGADLLVNIVQYDTPIYSGASTIAASSITGDFHIPITWAGQNRPAAVKAVRSDGVFLFDSWTMYLPAIQQGRMTYNNQWNWDGTGVIFPQAVVDAVKSQGLATTFTIEFYPRVPGNNVTLTMTV